jgi:hypothetical protein
LIIQTSLASPEFAATEPAMVRVQRVIERLKTIPEVKHVATVTRLPTEPSLVLSFELLSSDSQDQQPAANWRAVTPEFFEALRIPLHAGRSFSDRDSHDAIRFALGATRGRLLWLMATYGLKLLVPGLVVGIMLSLALRSVVASYLFGVSTTYVVVYVAVILLLSLIALIATLGPAMRATRVDLTAVLRQ